MGVFSIIILGWLYNYSLPCLGKHYPTKYIEVAYVTFPPLYSYYSVIQFSLSKSCRILRLYIVMTTKYRELNI